MLRNVVLYTYATPSADPKKQRCKLDAQYFRLAAYAQAHKLSVLKYYEDNGSAERPALQQIVSDYQARRFDAILVACTSQVPLQAAPDFPCPVVSIKASERSKTMAYLA